MRARVEVVNFERPCCSSKSRLWAVQLRDARVLLSGRLTHTGSCTGRTGGTTLLRISLKTYSTFGAALLVAGSAFGQQMALRSASDALLPDAPSSSVSAAEKSGLDLSSPLGAPQPNATYNKPGMVSKYTTIVDSGQSVERLTSGQKMLYAFREQASINALIGATASAGLSHALDNAPHYGHNKEAFAQRFGAAYARQTTQAVMTDESSPPSSMTILATTFWEAGISSSTVCFMPPRVWLW